MTQSPKKARVPKNWTEPVEAPTPLPTKYCWNPISGASNSPRLLMMVQNILINRQRWSMNPNQKLATQEIRTSSKADKFLYVGPRLRQVRVCRRTKLLWGRYSDTRHRRIAISFEIRDGLDQTWELVELSRLWQDILDSSQVDHPPASTRGRGDWRPRAWVVVFQDGLPIWRLGRRHLHVSTNRFHGDGGGRSPRMSIDEKPPRLKTIVEDVVLEIRLLHQETWLPPVRLRPMHVHSETGRWVQYLSDPIHRRRAHYREKSRRDRKTKAEPSWLICSEGTRTILTHTSMWIEGNRTTKTFRLSSPATYKRCWSASTWRMWSHHQLRFWRQYNYQTKTLHPQKRRESSMERYPTHRS